MPENSDKTSKPATQKKKTRLPYEILRDALIKVKFHHPMLDRELKLTPVALKWMDQLVFEYYYVRNIQKKVVFSALSRWKFRWIYRHHLSDYPFPLVENDLLLEHQVQAVPGNYLETNGFLGYFKPIRTSDGNFFYAPNGDLIQPFVDLLKALKVSLKSLLDQSTGDALRREMLILHYKDVSLNLEVTEFIPKIRAYGVQQHLPGLKSGHLICWISGMAHYLEELQAELTEMGFATYQADSQEPLMKLLLELQKRLESILLNLILDLFLPLLESVGVECKVEKNKLKFHQTRNIDRNWLSGPLDWFLSLFRKEELEKSETIKNPEIENQISEIKPKISKPEPKPLIKDLRPFSDLYSALEKFHQSLVEDLAPEVNEKGEVVDYKAMFDQFELPEEERDLTYTRFVLAGRLNGADPMDFRYKDQTIVSSTHWLYDRIREVLDRFDFVSSGVLTREDAFRFMEEVRLLFYPSRHETLEKRKYGTFVQFRINLRRLFVSNKTHSHYQALMNQISTLLDKAREKYEKEGRKS